MITVHTEVQKERSSYFILLSLEENTERPQPECLQWLKSCKQPEDFAAVGKAVTNGLVPFGTSRKQSGQCQGQKTDSCEMVCLNHKLQQFTTQC